MQAAIGETGIGETIAALAIPTWGVIACVIFIMTLTSLVGIHQLVSMIVVLVVFVPLNTGVNDTILMEAALIGWAFRVHDRANRRIHRNRQRHVRGSEDPVDIRTESCLRYGVRRIERPAAVPGQQSVFRGLIPASSCLLSKWEFGTLAPLAFRLSYLSGLFRRKSADSEFRQLGGRAARGRSASLRGLRRNLAGQKQCAALRAGRKRLCRRLRLSMAALASHPDRPPERHDLTTDRLLTDTGWDSDWIAGRLIFDGGAGAGRFSDALAMGARVVSLDMSIAIDACYETTRVHGDAVQRIQASLYAMPLRSAAFDAVHCAGVIQHTPEPERTMRAMPRLLKPGAPLGYNFYERTWSRRLQLLRAGFRLFTPYMSQRALLKLCEAMVVPLFPLSRLVSRLRFIRFGLRFLPICANHQPELSRDQQFEWTCRHLRLVQPAIRPAATASARGRDPGRGRDGRHRIRAGHRARTPAIPGTTGLLIIDCRKENWSG